MELYKTGVKAMMLGLSMPSKKTTETNRKLNYIITNEKINVPFYAGVGSMLIPFCPSGGILDASLFSKLRDLNLLKPVEL